MTNANRLKYFTLALRVVGAIAIWSSVVHGAVMAVQSMLNPQHIHHLYGDVLALFVIAAVLGFLSSEALRLRFSKSET